jgi:hypothetical protein
MLIISKLVDDNLSAGFFRLARRMARGDGDLADFLRLDTVATTILERTVAVAGRLAATMIRCETMVSIAHLSVDPVFAC